MKATFATNYRGAFKGHIDFILEVIILKSHFEKRLKGDRAGVSVHAPYRFLLEVCLYNTPLIRGFHIPGQQATIHNIELA